MKGGCILLDWAESDEELENFASGFSLEPGILEVLQMEIVSQTRQPSPEVLEENKLIRRLQMMMNMVMQVIAQDGSLTVDEASQMIADSKKAALAMFPDKELAYEIIWRPRFQRLMRERFRIN
jgi:hypothetical protein